jgi:hypothetical protein
LRWRVGREGGRAAVLWADNEREIVWLAGAAVVDHCETTIMQPNDREKQSFFECFPYVCPEPVLAK